MGRKRERVMGLRSPNSRAVCILILAATGFFTLPAVCGSAAPEAKLIFRKRCTACHTYGKGIKIGPDLKGVTDRRKRDWLLKFVNSSSTVIRSGDPTATKLYAEFKRERMPDWTDLSPQQIGSIMDWFASNGPEQKEPDERNATTATAAEIEAGRQLFHGNVSLASGGRACHACHNIRDAGGEREGARDGSLGPDLTTVYLKYQDRALTDFFKHPCFPRDPEISKLDYLTPLESFDLKAYLAQAGGLTIPAPPGPLSVDGKTAGSSDRKRARP
jgi:cytochrome c2